MWLIMNMCRGLLILILLVWYAEARRKFDSDLVYRHRDAVNQRITELRRYLVPLPEDQWTELLHHWAKLLVPVHAASELCRNHSLHLLEEFLQGEVWALRMVDASSKMQSGLLDGNLHNLGSYAQCTSVTEPDMMFIGQHCVIETTGMLPEEISNKISRKPLPWVDMEVTFSLCVPSSCTDEDIISHVDHSLAPLGVKAVSYRERLGLTTDIPQISCSTAEGIPFRTKDYFAMIVFASIALMVLLSSALNIQSGWLSCFSLSKNWKELMNTEPVAGEISCLNGLRVVLAMLPILGHQYFTTMIMPTDRLFSTLQFYTSVFVRVNEVFITKAVDQFFLMGGCVLSYSFLLKNHKKPNFDPVDFCFKKYFRLTPVLAVVMLYQATLLVHSGRGPLWLFYTSEYEDKCHVNWWAGLLHVSDLLVPQSMCVGESWFVAADFKLQCFALLLLPLLLRRPRLALVALGLCSLLSVAAATLAALYFQFSSGYGTALLYGDRLTDLHIQLFYRGTIFRAAPFLMGLILGYWIFVCKQRKTPYSLSKLTLWLGWTLASVTLAGITVAAVQVFSPDHQFMPVFDPLFLVLSRPLFCMCGAWLIFACFFGGGGIVDEFLSWPGFRPLGRLCYGVSLSHASLQLLQICSQEDPIIPNWTYEMLLYFGYIITSFFVAAVLYITVELPFYKLAGHIIKGVRGNKKLKDT